MANYRGRSVRRKHDDWFYWEKLPQAIRMRCAASTQPWSSSWLLNYYRKLVKAHGDQRATSYMLQEFDRWDSLQSRKTWIAPPVGKRAEPSPCAQADVGPLVTKYARVG